MIRKRREAWRVSATTKSGEAMNRPSNGLLLLLLIRGPVAIPEPDPVNPSPQDPRYLLSSAFSTPSTLFSHPSSSILSIQFTFVELDSLLFALWTNVYLFTAWREILAIHSRFPPARQGGCAFSQAKPPWFASWKNPFHSLVK